jgi:hypothetical protein
MPNFTKSELKTRVASMVSGTLQDADINTLLNKTATELWGEVDIRSSKRKSALSPNLFEDIYQYTCPTDLKGQKVIDVAPQTDRGRFDNWRLVTPEEFDRIKQDQRTDVADEPFKVKRSNWIGENLVAVSDYDFVRKLLLSRPVDDTETVISAMESTTNWSEVGDADSIAVDSSNYVRGSACLKWNIDAGGTTTAGISNSSLDAVDITDYLSEGSVFVWVYIVSTTNLTNFILRLGSDSSNYYSITVTTNNEGTSFYAGWNLLRFPMSSKSTTGTPDYENIDYVSLYMTKTAGKVSENGYRFDHLVIKLGKHYDVIFYSLYPWQSSSGTYLEESTADTDSINMDSSELSLFEYKYAEIAERFLKNWSQVEYNRKIYEEKKSKYEFQYPSEAMVLSNTYQMLNPENY